MNYSWRETILKEFIPQLSLLTLVADPDSLLSDEDLQESLRNAGFILVEYQDPIAFRYFFETTIRPSWAAAEQQEWIIVLHASPSELQQLPYDLLRYGRQLYFSLSDLFPNLTYHEVAVLEKSELDSLYQSQETLQPDKLGENASKDFILRHVFSLDGTIVKDEENLLSLLLQLHVRKRPIPLPFINRLQHQLQVPSRFENWPLDTLLTDPSVFFVFLQERWPLYLTSIAKEENVFRDSGNLAYGLQWPGPALLAFDAPNIRAFVDTLFLEGKLHPVSHSSGDMLKDSWVSIGLENDPINQQEKRIARLVKNLTERLSENKIDHFDWFINASLWGEINYLLSNPIGHHTTILMGEVNALRKLIDKNFEEWLVDRYRYLPTLSPHPPVMVHHIPRSLARGITSNSKSKAALVVLDGMSMSQWCIVRNMLKEQLPEARFEEKGVFAWIPTVTAVSRQALFAGKLPLYFPDSIDTTNKEPKRWTTFWEESGLKPNQVGYAKKLRSNADMGIVEELLHNPQQRVVGLVVDQIDHMMHGITLGLTGLHQQINLWMQNGFLATLLQQLNAFGYTIFLTSDHGNVEASGNGRPSEQALANLRGERVRVYPNEILRQQVNKKYEFASPWSTEGLPSNFYPLIASGRTAFITEGDTSVTHGGNLLEEVIVPFVQVDWRQ